METLRYRLKGTKMSKFISVLNENYKFWNEINSIESKLEYLGNIVFDFTTYSSNLDKYFAVKMLTVLEHIVNRTTFDYIKDINNHIEYITMCNSPFLTDKLEWGTSIRGAWLDGARPYKIDCGRIMIKEGELEEFVKDVIEWSKYESR